ncbi:restriction endonuclease subunit S [Gallibacterium anatis]|uniref:restriction endonuclease subunit S n=1 Tax=Gallibacterium anatis TaxID=750 RepID=UPI003003BC97
MKNHNIPKLRYPEFTDAWEKWELGKIADIFDNQRVPVAANERIKGKIPYYGANGIQDYVDGFTHQGEFVLLAEDGANDTKNYPCEYVEGKIWVNNHAHVLSGKKNLLNNLFLTSRIKSMDISPYLVGGGRAKLNAKVMLKIELSIPTLPEQQKIGNLFKQLDRLITLHKRKWDDVILLKKALLQKMFLKNGSDFPEIRFPEFTDAWEKWELGEVANIIMGQSPSSKFYTDNPKDYILVQGNADLKNGWVMPRVWTTQRTKVGKKGDLIFSVRAPVGEIGKTNYDVVLGRGVAAIQGNEFIFQTLSKMNIFGFWKTLSTGSTFDAINSNELRKVEINIPTLPEQQKIGNLFKQLDRLVTLHKRQHEHYQLLKKALLQQMFV